MTPDPTNLPKPDDKAPSRPKSPLPEKRVSFEDDKAPPLPTTPMPDLPVSHQKPEKPKRDAEYNVTRNLIQRHKHGSADTNTLNTPPLCKIDHLLIREVWGEPPAASPENNKKHRDPKEISRDIEKNQKALENAYYQLDDLALTNKLGAEADAERNELNKRILAIQDIHLTLDMERMAAQVSLAPYEPPKGVREFVIVETIPDKIQQEIDDAEKQLTPLREKLSTTLEEWFKAHTDHEAVKKELMAFAKKKRKLAEERDAARAVYEVSNRKEAEKNKNKEDREAEKNKNKEEKYKAFKKMFKQDAESKLKSADEDHKAAFVDRGEAREKFLAAQEKYREFAFHEYGRIRTSEKGLYNSLIEKLKAVNTVTNEIGKIEEKVREAKNTLVSGPECKIQMTSFALTNDKADWKKVPTVEVEVDTETRLFPEKTKVFCGEVIPKHNGPKKHPHVHILEPKSKLDGHGEGNVQTSFQIFENHRKFLKPSKGVFRFGVGVFTGIKAIFQHIFSAFPKKRYYKILAEKCGVKPFWQHGKLEAELEVFPADVYTMTLKMPPILGYDQAVREEKVMDQTKLRGEIADLNAGNTSTKEDHSVGSGSSFSVLGVTQSSTSTVYMTGLDGREMVTQTTMSREGFFGTSTTKDETTGFFINEEDGSKVAYSGSLERQGSVESQLLGDDSGKVVSLKQSYTSEDGTVTDQSKEVDSEGLVTAVADDESDFKEGTKGGRIPSMPTTFLPQIPVDLVLTCNGIEDPLTEDLRRTLGLIIFLVRKCGDIASRMGNMMPSKGWKFGFNMAFLTGNLSYTHGHREHVDKRVWLHHKFDVDVNIVTAKVFIFGGASYEFLLFTFQIGLEVYVRGSIGVKGQFEKTHPDADKGWDIGFGPTGSIGVGAEIKAIVGQPDWISATGTIESVFSVEATFWARKEDDGENSPFLEAAFKWEGVKLKGVAHVILVGHWEKEIELCKEREIWSGRFPKEDREDEIKNMLADQTIELEKSNRKRAKEAAELEKKMIKKGMIPAKPKPVKPKKEVIPTKPKK